MSLKNSFGPRNLRIFHSGTTFSTPFLIQFKKTNSLLNPDPEHKSYTMTKRPTKLTRTSREQVIKLSSATPVQRQRDLANDQSFFKGTTTKAQARKPTLYTAGLISSFQRTLVRVRDPAHCRLDGECYWTLLEFRARLKKRIRKSNQIELPKITSSSSVPRNLFGCLKKWTIKLFERIFMVSNLALALKVMSCHGAGPYLGKEEIVR